MKRFRRGAVWWCARGISRGVLGLGRVLYGLEIHGREHLPAKGPLIVTGNHSSRVDFFAGAFFFSATREIPVALTGIPAITHSRLLAWLCRELGLLPKFKTEGLSAASLLQVHNLLKEGKIVGMGGIDGEWTWDGRLQPLLPGTAWLALRTCTPIVLSVLQGGYDIWPRWARRPHLTGKLVLRLSKPFYLSGAPVERVTPELLEEANRRIRAEMEHLAAGGPSSREGAP